MTIERNDLSLDAVKIDGSYIEDLVTGYHTVKAVGRETLQRSFETLDLAKDGERLKKSKYPAREITVTFYVGRNSLAEMRESMTELMAILDKTEKTIIFNGDADYYYTGTPVMEKNVTETKNGLIGTFIINCFDPFKYSVNTISETAVNGEISINYSGTSKAYPEFTVSFPATRDANGDNTNTSECGFVGFSQVRGNNEYFLQFGDPDENDLADIDYPAENVLGREFSSVSGWTKNGSATLSADYVQTGDVSVNSTNKYMYPSDYGTNSGVFHGPSRSLVLTDVTSSTNFQFKWKQKFSYSDKKQLGCASVLLYNKNGNTRTLIAGVHLEKKESGKTTKINFYADGTTAKETVTVACSKVGESTITKDGTNVNIKIAGQDKDLTLSSATAAMVVNEVVFFFGRKGTKSAMANSYIYNCSLQRYAYTVENVDIQNKFQPGDVLTVKTADASVFLDSGSADVPADYLGALGNDWEDFVLMPGLNTIGVDYSSFATTPPVFVMTYRERFL